MNESNTLVQTLRRPAAFLPIAMSLFAVVILLIHIAYSGTAPQPDEGTAAHLWQLLMAGQLPIIAFFVIRRLPASPRYASVILGVQVAAAVAALAPVYFLHW